MRVLSLFSGIGGIDLGLERAGFTIAYHAEIEKYPAAVLRKHWPDVPNLGDVTKIKWEELENVDVIAGGYPCQPFSLVGRRRGTSDPRHLWPYVADAIRVLRPRFAFMENVRGHLSLGFGDVLSDLASIGYDAEWQVVSAASVGAPHRRDRVIIVAYPAGLVGEVCVLDQAEGLQEQPRGSASRGGASHWSTDQPSMGGVAHGIPERLDAIRGLGNAVVPQVAEWVGRRIMAHANAHSAL